MSREYEIVGSKLPLFNEVKENLAKSKYTIATYKAFATINYHKEILNEEVIYFKANKPDFYGEKLIFIDCVIIDSKEYVTSFSSYGNNGAYDLYCIIERLGYNTKEL